jgi:hypothetical protein
MQRSFSVHASLAAVALLIGVPAHAQSSATATYNFGILLTDLDPSDGVDPAVALDPLSRSTALPRDLSPTATTSWIRQGDSAFAPVSSSGELDGNGGSASFAGDPQGAGERITASAVSGTLFDVSAVLAYVDTPPTGQGRLALGPQTQVTFQGDVSIDWNASGPGAEAAGEVGLAFFQLVGDENLVRSEVSAGYWGDGPGALSGSTASPLAITFANATDAPLLLGYELDVGAVTAEQALAPSPVGEPADAGLLLAGLAALRWGATRRERRLREAQ